MKQRAAKKLIASMLVLVMLVTTIPLDGITIKAQSQNETKVTEMKETVTKRDVLDYTLFSGSQSCDLTFAGWKSNIRGNIYVGNSFISQVSELTVDGAIDAVGTAKIEGWKQSIQEKNENITPLEFPALANAISKKANELQCIGGNTSYITDKTIINGAISVGGDLTISGTTFEGNCIIIAEGNITYQVNSFASQGSVVLYSKNGNITISGSDIAINGIIFAPNGSVTFQTYQTTLNGRVFSDNIQINSTIFNAYGEEDDFDFLFPKKKGIKRIYTTDEDFAEGTMDGTSSENLDELILAKEVAKESEPVGKRYGDDNLERGISVEESLSNSFVSDNMGELQLSYDLRGYGVPDESGSDIVLLVDESGSMLGTKKMKAIEACKNVVKMLGKEDRCGIIGFAKKKHLISELTSDKDALIEKVEKLNAYGDTSISKGLGYALNMLIYEDTSRPKYIFVITDGIDTSDTKVKALQALDNNIKIYSIMIGENSLQMQNVSEISKGVYKNAPSAEFIEVIMNQFGKEVLNTAGRNAIFQTRVLSYNKVDTSKWSRKPDIVEEHSDGSATLQWKFPRFDIDDIEKISIPFIINGIEEKGFVDLTEDSSLLYYTKEGRPVVIYLDNVSVPVCKYRQSGTWETVYDSNIENCDWKQISWNGRRYADSEIIVNACVSNDGDEFSEPFEVTNYDELNDVKGRYLKLEVTLNQSYDGQTPELFDITIVSEGEELENYTNTIPEASIISSGMVKENRPLKIRIAPKDDCQSGKIKVTWSSKDEEVSIGNSTAFYTTFCANKPGEYEVSCTVDDGEQSVVVKRNILVEEQEKYLDIDPETNLNPPPNISCILPETVIQGQEVTATIDLLNDTEIAWYSVVLSGEKVVDVTEDGAFSVRMPEKDGIYTFVIKAYDWAGQFDEKEYKVEVKGARPTVTVIASKDTVRQDEECYFAVTTTAKESIKSVTYTLNDEVIELDENSQYQLETKNEGVYTLKAVLEMVSGEIITASATVEVLFVDRIAPVINVEFDKESYYAEETARAVISVTDNIGVVKTKVTYNDGFVYVEDNLAVLKRLKLGDNIIVIDAWDKEGNHAQNKYIIHAEEKPDTTSPTLTVDLGENTRTIELGDTLPVLIKAEDDRGEVTLNAIMDGVEQEVVDGKVVFTPETPGEHEIIITARDEAGNETKQVILITVRDMVCPIVDIELDKESYTAGDELNYHVTATDNDLVQKIEVTVDGVEDKLDETNTGTIKSLEAREYVIEAKAYDRQGNWSSQKVTLNVSPKIDESDKICPEVVLNVLPNPAYVGDEVTIHTNAIDNVGVVDTRLFVDGEEYPIENGSVVVKVDTKGIKEVKLIAKDAAGNEGIATTNLVVNEKPSGVAITLNKPSYYVGEDIVFTVVPEVSENVVSIVATVDGELVQLSDNQGIIKNAVEKVYEISAKAFDENGSYSSYTIQVPVIKQPAIKDTIKPDVTLSVDPKQVNIGDEITIEVEATDNEKVEDIILYVDDQPVELVNGKATVTANKEGTILIKAVAKDAAGNEGSAIEQVVVGEISSSLKVTLQLNYAVAFLGTPITAYVSVDDPSKLKDLKVIAEGEEISLSNGTGTFTPKEAGYVTVKAYATDVDGVVSTDEKVVQVIDTDDIITPFVDISSPEDNSEITAPTTITGTVRDDKKLVVWKLGYRKYTEDLSSEERCQNYDKYYTVIASGKDNIEEEELGKLDTTLLENGLYELGLYAQDAGGNIVCGRMKVTVTGDLKFGNMSIGFTDISTNVAGINMSVTRQYSSMNLEKGDFGYGWTLGIDDIKMYESSKAGEGWNQTSEKSGFFTVYTLTQTKNHTITLVYGDGTSDEFELVPDFGGSSAIYPRQVVFVNYLCKTNSNVKLEIVGSNQMETLESYIGDITYYNEGGYGESCFDPQVYKLTKADGTQVIIHKKDGVQSITDIYGNVTKVTENGIVNSEGKGISFVRDTQGRIITATDPNGDDVNYEYDDNGDLVAFYNKDDTKITFTYDKKHHLIGLYGPNGEKVARTVYDDDGRLIATIDADGNEVKYDYDVEGRTQVVRDQLGNPTVYVYNDDGKLLKETDPLGNSITYTYSDNGDMLTSTNANGDTTTFTYDDNHNMLTQSDEYGNTVTCEYSTQNRPSKITDRNGVAMDMVYDEQGNMTSYKDQEGNETTYNYNAQGKLTDYKSPLGAITKYTYDEQGNLTSEIDALGNKKSYAYDSNGKCTSVSETRLNEEGVQETIVRQNVYDSAGNLVKIIYPDGSFTTKEYDELGHEIATVDEQNNRIEKEYDTRGNVSKITYPDGTIEKYEYDAASNNTAIINRDGTRVEFYYDKAGRMTKQINPEGTFISYEYDKLGNVISCKDEMGNETTYTYDHFGRNLTVTNALGNTTTYVYTNAVEATGIIDANGNETKYVYDCTGKCTEVEYADGTKVKTEYDADGNVTAIVDEEGNQTDYTYDAVGQLIKVTDVLGNETEYTYDQQGNLVVTKDANGRETKYTYDTVGNQTSRTLPLGMSEFFEYDAAGNLVQYTDFNGKTTLYQYNNLNQLVKVTYPDYTTEEYIYNINGLYSKVIDSRGTTTYSYDILSRLTRQNNPDGTWIAYEYDDCGNITAINTSNKSTEYTHDELGRITKVCVNDEVVAEYEYDKVNNIIQITHGNGTVTKYECDKRYRPVRIKNENENGIVLSNLEYKYSKSGACLSIIEQDCKTEYKYDKLYRLVQEDKDYSDEEKTDISITYEYDKVGNRTKMVSQGVESILTYDENDRLLSDGQYTYSYDNNGNLLTKVGGEEKYQYVYDFNDRMIKSVAPSETGTETTKYVYDFNGIRVQKNISDNDITNYLVDSNCQYPRVLEESDQSGVLLVTYTYGNRLVSQTRGEQIRYYHGDNIGSIRMLTDDKGVITDQYSYDAFGNLLEKTGTTQNVYLYSGEQFDSETALYYLRARYMDTETGRFISADKYSGTLQNPVSQHKYQYVENNPATNVDPSGHFGMIGCVCTSAINSIISTSLPVVLNIVAYGMQAGFVMGYYQSYYQQCAQMLDAALKGQEIDQMLEAFTKVNMLSAICGAMMGGIFSLSSFLPCIFVKVATLALTGLTVIKNGEKISDAVGKGNYFEAIYLIFDTILSIASLADLASSSCFVEGTMVSTVDGKKDIKDIKVGEYVYTKNMDTGKVEIKKVLATSIKEYQKLIILQIGDEKIKVTPNHCFFVDGQGWVEAGELSTEDCLVSNNGKKLEIVSISVEVLEQPLKVYNLTVESNHTYFVGEFDVLVHNMTCARAKELVQLNEDGTYTILNWDKYPGPHECLDDMHFMLLEDKQQYEIARNAADAFNKSLHRKNLSNDGYQIHEIVPVKHGGSPTDIDNKIALLPSEHRKYTSFWNEIMWAVRKMLKMQGNI